MKKLSLLLAALLLLTSCSSLSARSGSAPVELTFYSSYDGKEAELVQSRIKMFESENPNIKVNVKEVTFSSDSFKTALLGDQPVDVFRSDNSWVPELASLGLLYPIENMISAEDRKDFVPSALRSDEFEGHLYGLPTVMEALALLYNKSLLQEKGFAQAPQTMQELSDMSKALKTANRYGIYVSDNSFYALPYIWAFGGGTMTDDRQVEIAKPASIEALSFMRNLIKEGAAQPYPDFSDSYNVMMSDFKEGRSVFMINGPWAVSDLLTGSQFKDASNLGIAVIPKGPKGDTGSPAGGHSLVISKYSKHPKESYALIHYLTSKESQLLHTKELKSLPSRNSAYEDDQLMSDPIVQGFKMQLDAAKARPLIPEGAQMFTDFTPNLVQILTGQQSAEAGAKKIEAAWRTLLGLDK
ncbi:ABC transporter substrate-binding protein [Saccharibacillus sp. O16]|nr:ABC transporter substrate-binding protein [Saccharibacillus sp. O16]